MKINYKLLGKQVATRRNQLSLTQADLAEMIGLSSKHISNIETGKSVPRVPILMQICKKLDISPNFLLFGIDDETETEVYLETYQKLKLCSEKQMRLVSGFIDLLLQQNED